VDWYPWGEEAFAKAREENKPIFLSIGYSTCHWCHVMERESFESDSIAKILNANFVSIKVDREERPDVDAVYMAVLQGMTGSGGWPMSLFLTPDLKPFFAGTYYPPIPAHGRPSFSQLLERIHDLWMTERSTLVNSSVEITQALSKSIVTSEANEVSAISKETLDEVFGHFEQIFDPIEGGFGGAPKFPRPVQFDFLFQYYQAFDHASARDMALVTLRKMALGGMHDHLGGGFHRYSVDRYWRISHFEKMLYDQAQLVNSYLDAWQITHDPFDAGIVRSTIEYVLRDLTDPDGGFYSAEDADSEGEEGKFYVWTLEEFESILVSNAEVSSFRFGVTTEGNFEHGKNVLYLAHTLDETAQFFDRSRLEIEDILESNANKLIAVRANRIRPLRDDKILTSWNGLMIGAMARAGDVLNEQRYITSAIAAGEFIWNNLRPNGNLLHRWRDGDERSSAEARFDAYLDDYAFLINGYLDLYEATFDPVWMKRAILLQEEQDTALYDPENSGYFDARPAPDLILRAKNSYDGAEPSGNSITVLNLFRLANLTENDRYKARAEETLQAFAAKVRQYPYAMPELMTAAFWSLTSPTQLVFAGDDLDEFRSVLNDRYLPVSVKLRRENSDVAFTRSLPEMEGVSSVYVCKNFVCQLPVTSPSDLEKLLSNA
jgi:uncharacterized protein YyaL (SSP411 family)